MADKRLQAIKDWATATAAVRADIQKKGITGMKTGDALQRARGKAVFDPDGHDHRMNKSKP